MKQLLEKLNACEEAREWAGDKSWEEVYTTCHRGDWLLWLFAKTNPKDLRLLTLAKGHCANTVRLLMADQRSIDAVDAAIAFGEGRIGVEELKDAASAAAYAASYAAAYAASAAVYAVAAHAADAASYAAAYAAAYAASAAAYAASATYAAAHTSYDASAAACAKEENQKLTADIVRKYIPIEKFNITSDS